MRVSAPFAAVRSIPGSSVAWRARLAWLKKRAASSARQLCPLYEAGPATRPVGGAASTAPACVLSSRKRLRRVSAAFCAAALPKRSTCTLCVERKRQRKHMQRRKRALCSGAGGARLVLVPPEERGRLAWRAARRKRLRERVQAGERRRRRNGTAAERHAPRSQAEPPRRLACTHQSNAALSNRDVRRKDGAQIDGMVYADVSERRTAGGTACHRRAFPIAFQGAWFG
jgi:hypothetical protein